MGKRIVNPIAVILTRTDGTVEARVDYGVDCDDGLSARNSTQPDFTAWPADLRDKVNDIMDRGWDEAEIAEEIQ